MSGDAYNLHLPDDYPPLIDLDFQEKTLITPIPRRDKHRRRASIVTVSTSSSYFETPEQNETKNDLVNSHYSQVPSNYNLYSPCTEPSTSSSMYDEEAYELENTNSGPPNTGDLEIEFFDKYDVHEFYQSLCNNDEVTFTESEEEDEEDLSFSDSPNSDDSIDEFLSDEDVLFTGMSTNSTPTSYQDGDGYNEEGSNSPFSKKDSRHTRNQLSSNKSTTNQLESGYKAEKSTTFSESGYADESATEQSENSQQQFDKHENVRDSSFDESGYNQESDNANVSSVRPSSSFDESGYHQESTSAFDESGYHQEETTARLPSSSFDESGYHQESTTAFDERLVAPFPTPTASSINEPTDSFDSSGYHQEASSGLPPSSSFDESGYNQESSSANTLPSSQPAFTSDSKHPTPQSGFTSSGYNIETEQSPIESGYNADASTTNSDQHGNQNTISGSNQSTKELNKTTESTFSKITKRKRLSVKNKIQKMDILTDEGVYKIQQEARDWNKEYQYWLHYKESKLKYEKLVEINHSFVVASELYGKVIISERTLANDKKTIKSVDIGGVAGGIKFIVQNILFKFACDQEVQPGNWLYGGKFPNQELAMKAAKHELSNLIAFSEAKESVLNELPEKAANLLTPLMTLIDYRGYRLIAMPILPIPKENKGLVYGSNDGGKTVHNDDFRVSISMKFILGDALRLRKHLAGFNCPQEIFGPGDLECHMGIDGHYYVLDFGRLLPPEAPINKMLTSKTIFYNLLRKEYLTSEHIKLPINSDSFSSWSKLDPHFKRDCEYLTQVTTYLRENLIAKFVEDTLLQKKEIEVIAEGYGAHLWLCNELHACGINLRYLGYLRTTVIQYLHTTTDKAKAEILKKWEVFILEEIYSRAISHLIRIQQRYELSKKNNFIQNKLIAQLINQLLQHNPEVLHKMVELINMKYVDAIDAKEENFIHKGSIWREISIKNIFKRIAEKNHFSFSARFQQGVELEEQKLKVDKVEINILYPPKFSLRMINSDIVRIEAKIWRTNLMEKANCLLLFYEFAQILGIKFKPANLQNVFIFYGKFGEYQQHHLKETEGKLIEIEKITERGILSSPISIEFHYLFILANYYLFILYFQYSNYFVDNSAEVAIYQKERGTTGRDKFVSILKRINTHSKIALNIFSRVNNTSYLDKFQYFLSYSDIFLDGVYYARKENKRSSEFYLGVYDNELLANNYCHFANYVLITKPKHTAHKEIITWLFPNLLIDVEKNLMVYFLYRTINTELMVCCFLFYKLILSIFHDKLRVFHFTEISAIHPHKINSFQLIFERIILGVALFHIILIATPDDTLKQRVLNNQPSCLSFDTDFFAKYCEFNMLKFPTEQSSSACENEQTFRVYLKISVLFEQIKENKSILKLLKRLILQSFYHRVNSISWEALLYTYFLIRDDSCFFSQFMEWKLNDFFDHHLKNDNKTDPLRNNSNGVMLEIIRCKANTSFWEIVSLNAALFPNIEKKRSKMLECLKNCRTLETQNVGTIISAAVSQAIANELATIFPHLITCNVRFLGDVHLRQILKANEGVERFELKKFKTSESLSRANLLGLFRKAKNLVCLEVHSISGDLFQDDFLDILANAPYLTKIRVANLYFNGKGNFFQLSQWGKLKHLKSLFLGHGNYTAQELQSLFTSPHFCNLEKVDLRLAGNLTDFSFSTNFQLSNIKALNLYQCNRISASNWNSFPTYFPNLTKLRASCVVGITDEVLSSILKVAPLHFLDISSCRNVNGSFLDSNDLHAYQTLAKLDVQGCRFLPDKWELFSKLKALESLNLDQTGISPDCLFAVVNACPKLHVLNFPTNCSATTFQLIVQTHPIFTEISYYNPNLSISIVPDLAKLPLKKIHISLPLPATYQLAQMIPTLAIEKVVGKF